MGLRESQHNARLLFAVGVMRTSRVLRGRTNEARELVLESGTSDLDIWLQDGSDPARHTVEAAVRIYGMKVTADAGEKGNIIVDGLIFERTGAYGIYFFSNGEEGTGPSGVIIPTI
jgi:hypothetical protein